MEEVLPHVTEAGLSRKNVKVKKVNRIVVQHAFWANPSAEEGNVCYPLELIWR